MHRATRPVAALALLAAIVATLVTACGSEPPVPELTDPTEILTAAATTTAAATSVHIDLTADGELSLGVGGAAAPFTLDETTVNAELDLAAGEWRATFAIPGVLGLRGEVIVVDGTAYAKTTLTGPQYVAVPVGDASAPVDPSASPGTDSALVALSEFLSRSELAPVKGDDVECGGTTCYQVTVRLTVDELAALLGEGAGIEAPIPSGLPIPMPDLSGVAGVDVTVRVEKATTRLAGLTLVATTGAGDGSAESAGAAATVTAEIRFSNWDEAVSVEAPPADQVQGGS